MDVTDERGEKMLVSKVSRMSDSSSSPSKPAAGAGELVKTPLACPGVVALFANDCC